MHACIPGVSRRFGCTLTINTSSVHTFKHNSNALTLVRILQCASTPTFQHLGRRICVCMCVCVCVYVWVYAPKPHSPRLLGTPICITPTFQHLGRRICVCVCLFVLFSCMGICTKATHSPSFGHFYMHHAHLPAS